MKWVLRGGKVKKIAPSNIRRTKHFFKIIHDNNYSTIVLYKIRHTNSVKRDEIVIVICLSSGLIWVKLNKFFVAKKKKFMTYSIIDNNNNT